MKGKQIILALPRLTWKRVQPTSGGVSHTCAVSRAHVLIRDHQPVAMSLKVTGIVRREAATPVA